MHFYHLHFTDEPEMETLRALVARHFEVQPASVFIYSDAVELFGSATQPPNETLWAQHDASSVQVMVRPYDIGSGPLAGWLRMETRDIPLGEARPLARFLAAETQTRFFYNDLVRDPHDPSGDDAQIEVSPDGAERKIWIVEYGGEGGKTLTAIDDRP